MRVVGGLGGMSGGHTEGSREEGVLKETHQKYPLTALSSIHPAQPPDHPHGPPSRFGRVAACGGVGSGFLNHRAHRASG